MYPVSQTVNRTLPTALDPGMNMLLSETRISNAEIRMGMSKISDNVQKLLDKVCISIRGWQCVDYNIVTYVVPCTRASKCDNSYER